MRLVNMPLPQVLERRRLPWSNLQCVKCGHEGREVAWGLDRLSHFDAISPRCLDIMACARRAQERVLALEAKRKECLDAH